MAGRGFGGMDAKVRFRAEGQNSVKNAAAIVSAALRSIIKEVSYLESASSVIDRLQRSLEALAIREAKLQDRKTLTDASFDAKRVRLKEQELVIEEKIQRAIQRHAEFSDKIVQRRKTIANQIQAATVVAAKADHAAERAAAQRIHQMAEMERKAATIQAILTKSLSKTFRGKGLNSDMIAGDLQSLQGRLNLQDRLAESIQKATDAGRIAQAVSLQAQQQEIASLSSLLSLLDKRTQQHTRQKELERQASASRLARIDELKGKEAALDAQIKAAFQARQEIITKLQNQRALLGQKGVRLTEEEKIRVRQLTEELQRLGAERDSINNKLEAAQNDTANAFQRLVRSAKAFTQAIKENPEQLQKLAISAGLVGAALAAWKLVQVTTQAIKFGMEIERNSATIEALSGSISNAKEVMRDLFDLAGEMPLKIEKGMEAARTMLATGTPLEDMKGDMKALGTIAAAVNQPMNQLAVIYGELRTKNQIYREDILQFSRRGIPVMKALADMYGYTHSELSQLVKDGALKFEHFQAAMNRLAVDPSKFGLVDDKVMRTNSGKFEKVAADFQKISAGFYEQFGSAVVSDFVDTLEDAAEALSLLGDAYVALFGDASKYREAVEEAANEQLRLAGIEIPDEVSDNIHENIKRLNELDLLLAKLTPKWWQLFAKGTDIEANKLLQDRRDNLEEIINLQKDGKWTSPSIDLGETDSARNTLERRMGELLSSNQTKAEKYAEAVRAANDIFKERTEQAEKAILGEEAINRIAKDRLEVLQALQREYEADKKKTFEDLENQIKIQEGVETEIEQKARLKAAELELKDVEAARLRTLYERIDANDKSEKAAEEAAQKQKKEAEDAQKEAEKLAERVSEITSSTQAPGLSNAKKLKDELLEVQKLVQGKNLGLGEASAYLKQVLTDAMVLKDTFSSTSTDIGSLHSMIQQDIINGSKSKTVTLPPSILNKLSSLLTGSGNIDTTTKAILKELSDLNLDAKAG